MLSDAQKEDYARDGFVFVPGLVSDSEMPALRAACDRVVAKTRAGEWPHRRVVGKQFPPYDNDNPDSWGVQHVMHPALGEPAFVRWYGSEGVVGTAVSLLECQEEEIQMGESPPMSILGCLRRSTMCSICHMSQNSSTFSLTRNITTSLYDGTETMSLKQRVSRRKPKHSKLISSG